jgi:hypothetical protein
VVQEGELDLRSLTVAFTTTKLNYNASVTLTWMSESGERLTRTVKLPVCCRFVMVKSQAGSERDAFLVAVNYRFVHALLTLLVS